MVAEPTSVVSGTHLGPFEVLLELVGVIVVVRERGMHFGQRQRSRKEIRQYLFRLDSLLVGDRDIDDSDTGLRDARLSGPHLSRAFDVRGWRDRSPASDP